MSREHLPTWDHELGNLLQRLAAAERLLAKGRSEPTLDAELLQLAADAKEAYRLFWPELDDQAKTSFALFLERLAALQSHER